MTFIDKFEQKFVFGLTRVLAMIFIVGILVTITIGGVFVLMLLKPAATEVHPAEVIETFKSSVGDKDNLYHSLPVSDVLGTLKIPFSLQKKLDPAKLEILRSWLKDIPENQRSRFLIEMAAVTEEAERSGIVPIDAINKYVEIKKEKLVSAKQLEDERWINITSYGIFAGGCMVLIALCSLVLVLLSVERNTRKNV